MRNPHLIARVLRGASVHPHLKYYTSKKVFGRSIKTMANKFENLNLNAGKGITHDNPHVKKIRKPLKFLC
jgi:hypothetical protein